MNDFNKYITPLYPITERGDTVDLINPALEIIRDTLGLSDELIVKIMDYVVTILDNYGDMEYHLIPIYKETEYERITAMSRLYAIMFTDNFYLLQNLTMVNGIIKNDGLDSFNEDKMVYDNSTNSSGNKSTDYGKNIIKTINAVNYKMDENAPLNATLETINTPNRKEQNKGNSDTTDKHTGTDSISVSDNTTKSGSDTRTVKSPENYQKYISLLEEYSIFTMIDHIIRKGIYEFNRVF